MSAEEILSSLGSILSVIGSYLWKLMLWLFELLSTLFGHIALAISTWISTFTPPMLPTFLKIFSNTTLNVTIFFVIVVYIIIMNIASFMMFGIDKKRSKKRRAQRIPERTLMALSFWGGALGSLLGMQIFKHKTQHRKFTIFIPVLFAIQLISSSVLLGFLGFWAFF